MHVIGVALQGDHPGGHHLRPLLVGEVGGNGVRGVFVVLGISRGGPHHKDGGHHAVLFQNGPGIFVVAQVAVVKGDDDGLVRQGLALVDIGGQVVRENGGVACLGQGGDLGLEERGGHGGGVVALLVDVVVHEHGNLRGIGLCGQRRGLGHVRKVLLDVVRGDIDTEVIGNVQGVIPEYPGQSHLTHAVAEVGLVVEVPGFKADRAVREIPVGRDLGQTGVKVGHLIPGKIVHVIRVHRGAEDDEVDPVLLAQVPDAGQTLQGSGDGLLVGGVGGLRVVGENGICLQVSVHISDGLCIPYFFVVGAGNRVKDIEGLGEVGVLPQGLQLVQTVAGVHEEVFGQKRGGVFPCGLRGHGVGQRVWLGVVVFRVVQIDVDHQIFDFIVLHQVERLLFHIQHVRTVHNHIVKAGVQVGIEGLYREGAGGGTA